MTPPIGRLAIVVHSHLPWLLGHGRWPVGEEWLRQAWAHSYIPVIEMLRERAERGQRSMLTLGITPVLAAQWDEPTSVTEQSRWIEDWRLRAIGKGIQTQGDQHDAYRDALRHFRAASHAARQFQEHWSAGGSAAIRPLVDSEAIELLGGPATHTFTPHLVDEVANAALESGLNDATVRFGRRPRGIWTPECAYAPGMQDWYSHHGVTHTMLDGPTLQGVGASLHRPHRIAGSDTVVFGRDLSLTYRVWSPKRGYPGGKWYQDFHSFDHGWGLRAFRVSDKTSSKKEPYDPERAHSSAIRDAHDFLEHARRTLAGSTEPDPVVVVAYDTELFGHWWHEGPVFLAEVIDQASAAGIELTTLDKEIERASDGPAIEIGPGSWGSGKDFRVWESGEAGDLDRQGRGAQYAVLAHLTNPSAQESTLGRKAENDYLVSELLLALASDWAFMITKDSAADYARARSREHFQRVADFLRSTDDPHIHAVDTRLPFIDARYCTKN